MRSNFGVWGGHVELFDIYEDWRDERKALIESGVNPRTGQEFGQDLSLLEASPDTKADFATFLWEPIQASFFLGYQYVQSQYEKWIGSETVNSFDEIRIKGINSLTGVGYVGDLGDYPGLRRTFRPEAALAIDTYGGQYAMTRKLLRSQGVDRIVQRNPQDLGQAMGDYVTRLIVAFVVANPNAPDGSPMYSTGRGNLVVALLNEDELIDAAVWLRTRTDPDNRPIRVDAVTAVVQNDRQAIRLRQIITSQVVQYQLGTVATPDDAQGRGTRNAIPDSSILPADGVVIDPWFPDANDVYFFSDPNVLPAYAAGYLDGQKQPMIGMKDATVMHLANSNGAGHDPYSYRGDAIEYKTRHDIGVTAVEPLGTYRLAPA